MAGAAKKVWIVLQQREGKLNRVAWEAIAAGQELARTVDGSAEAVLLGSGMESLAEEVKACRLERLHVADDAKLAEYTPGAYVGALVPALEAASPDYVVFPHTYQSSDYMARVAQRLGAGLLPEVLSFADGEDGLVWKRPILQGKMHARVRLQGEGMVVLSVQSGSFDVDAVVKGSCEVVPLAADLSEVDPERELLGVEDVAGDAVDLSSAEMIVSVGRGIGDPEKMGIVEELAKALGAEIGASRPVIDNGWLPRDRQIGSSGQTVAPKLYLAVGISGAIQHLVGMKASTCVVAINKDPGAPIFTVAQYGIVGDLHEVVPALTAAVVEAKSR